MLPQQTSGGRNIVTGAAAQVDTISTRTRAEYLEMPGLRLTPAQAQRLFDIEPAVCERVLNKLVEEKFLCVKVDGTYARLTDGVPSPRPLKADVKPNTTRDAA
jgi:hypothetical protein